MPRWKSLDGSTRPPTLQGLPDALDVIGSWCWDAASDWVRSDRFVARLFDVDPEEAEAGLPLSAYGAGIHAADRSRLLTTFREAARNGWPYVSEFRVISADGVLRWVLARGRFSRNHLRRPVGGSGIVVDITDLRTNDGDPAFTQAETGFLTGEPPLERAAAAAMIAYRAIDAVPDPGLKAR
jgi:PAS domain-containing protein